MANLDRRALCSRTPAPRGSGDVAVDLEPDQVAALAGDVLAVEESDDAHRERPALLALVEVHLHREDRREEHMHAVLRDLLHDAVVEVEEDGVVHQPAADLLGVLVVDREVLEVGRGHRSSLSGKRREV